jgi:hypothetical protein
VIKQATLTKTGAASRTVEFVAVANVVPASTALYAAVDELKHRKISLPDPAIEAAEGRARAIPTNAA